MATRKRKPADKKFAAFRTGTPQETPEEQDLKKVKANTIQELAEDKEKEKEWYDNELEKNLKNSK